MRVCVVCVGGLKEPVIPTTHQPMFCLVREPKRPYLCTEVSSKVSSKKGNSVRRTASFSVSQENQTKRSWGEIRRYLLAVSTGHHMPHTPAIVQQKMA